MIAERILMENRCTPISDYVKTTRIEKNLTDGTPG